MNKNSETNLARLRKERGLERELSSFFSWCNSAANNPCSERAVNGVYTSLFKALRFIDVKTSAHILYQMYEATIDLIEFNDEINDIFLIVNMN